MTMLEDADAAADDSGAGGQSQPPAAEGHSQPPAAGGHSQLVERPRPATDLIADGVRTRSSYAVSLELFEGPLDLLLHLVRRHELDILDIPIAFITEKYIEYINFARELDIEIAGDYLLMAATLAFLKSRELLPSSPVEEGEEDEEEEGVDPREELIRRLIEYEKFRFAGEELSARPLAGRDVFPRGGSLDITPPEPGLAAVTLFKLAEAYNRVLDRAKVRQDHEVVIEPVTVRQRMYQLSVLLNARRKLSFEGLFLTRTWSNERELRQMLVVTLMSVLEMVKLGLIGVHQPHGSETLELERMVEVDEMQTTIAEFHEEGEDEAESRAKAASELAAVEVPLAEVEALAAEVEVETEALVEGGPALESSHVVGFTTVVEHEGEIEGEHEIETEIAAETEDLVETEAALESGSPTALSELPVEAVEAEPEHEAEPEARGEPALEPAVEVEPDAEAPIAALSSDTSADALEPDIEPDLEDASSGQSGSESEPEDPSQSPEGFVGPSGPKG